MKTQQIENKESKEILKELNEIRRMMNAMYRMQYDMISMLIPADEPLPDEIEEEDEYITLDELRACLKS